MESTEAEKVEKNRQETDRLDRERKWIRNMKVMFALFSAILLFVLLSTYFLNR
jgi:hypothetical protein